MKKTLIALAAVAATAGVAHAQSSVTLYGLVDAGVGRTTTQATGAVPSAKLSQTVVNSSGLNNSRWGLRGTEDLGGGLKANFVLESGFNTDTGGFANLSEQGNTIFGRAAWVGLSGDFGAVALGRQYTAYDALRGATNNNFDNNFAVTSAVWGGGTASLQGYRNRASNSISYTSNVYAGFSGAVVYGTGEDKTAANPTASNTSLHIKYANGPVLIGYAHQREKQYIGSTYFGSNTTAAPAPGPALPAVASDKRTYDLFAGSYNFGVAKITGGYNRAEDNNQDAKQYQVGVSMPLGATTLAVGYARSKVDGSAGQIDLTNKGFGFSATYDLSKRTALYAGYLQTKIESGAGAVTETKNTTFLTGVKHVF